MSSRPSIMNSDTKSSWREQGWRKRWRGMVRGGVREAERDRSRLEMEGQLGGTKVKGVKWKGEWWGGREGVGIGGGHEGTDPHYRFCGLFYFLLFFFFVHLQSNSKWVIISDSPWYLGEPIIFCQPQTLETLSSLCCFSPPWVPTVHDAPWKIGQIIRPKIDSILALNYPQIWNKSFQNWPPKLNNE
jgi:hypothetical protein